MRDGCPVHGGNVWRAAAMHGGCPSDYTDFSANMNPLGPPAGTAAVARGAVDQMIHYPEPEADSFITDAAKHYDVSTDMVVAGNGAAELIAALPFLPYIKRAIIPQPTFAQYEQAARRAGIPVVAVPPAGPSLRVNTDAVVRQAQAGDAVFLCQPNNPTGMVVPASELEHTVKRLVSVGAWPVIDQSFLPFIGEGPSAIPMLRQGYPLFIVVSLTKVYAIPGLRLGVLLGPKEAVARVQSQLVPWRVNAIAAAVGRHCIAQDEYVLRTRQVVPRWRQQLYEGLHRVPGVRPLHGAANFMLVNTKGAGVTGRALVNALMQHRLLVRDAANFPYVGDFTVRVAVRPPGDNQRLLDVLARVLGA